MNNHILIKRCFLVLLGEVYLIGSILERIPPFILVKSGMLLHKNIYHTLLAPNNFFITYSKQYLLGSTIWLVRYHNTNKNPVILLFFKSHIYVVYDCLIIGLEGRIFFNKDRLLRTLANLCVSLCDEYCDGIQQHEK